MLEARNGRTTAVSFTLAGTLAGLGLTACGPRRVRPAPGELSVVYEDATSAFMRRRLVRLHVDGALVASLEGSAKGRAALHTGALPAGRHELALEVTFRGPGFGVFSYTPADLVLRSTRTVRVSPLKTSHVTVVTTEARSPTSARVLIAWRDPP